MTKTKDFDGKTHIPDKYWWKFAKTSVGIWIQSLQDNRVSRIYTLTNPITKNKTHVLIKEEKAFACMVISYCDPCLRLFPLHLHTKILDLIIPDILLVNTIRYMQYYSEKVFWKWKLIVHKVEAYMQVYIPFHSKAKKNFKWNQVRFLALSNECFKIVFFNGIGTLYSRLWECV